MDHYSGTFLYNSSFYSGLCASVGPLGHALLQRLGVIGIIAILIYALYQKKLVRLKVYTQIRVIFEFYRGAVTEQFTHLHLQGWLNASLFINFSHGHFVWLLLQARHDNSVAAHGGLAGPQHEDTVASTLDIATTSSSHWRWT